MTNETRAIDLPTPVTIKRPRRFHAVERFGRRNPPAAVSALIIILLLAIAAIGPSIAPSHYNEFDTASRLQGPTLEHPFGTDNQGRDILSRIIYGARTTVIVGFGATLLAVTIAAAVGSLSGYCGGRVDLVIQRVIEVWQSFPGLVFIIFVVSIFGRSTTVIVLVIGCLFSVGTSRVVRSVVLSIKEDQYVLAARAVGAAGHWIVLRHILPNIVPLLIVLASVQVGAVVLIEASLSFLGYGTRPPFPSWGRMLNEAQPFMRRYEYMAIAPGIAIAVVVYAFNMLGDGLRDSLDPRMRGAR